MPVCTELHGVLAIVRPSVPLDEADRIACAIDDKDVRRLRSVDPGTVFVRDRGKIERLMPPRVDVRFGQPAL